MSSNQKNVMDRRTFLKVLGATGVSAAFVTTLSGVQQVQAQGPVAEQVASVTGVKFGKSVPLATEGPGFNLKWQPGDTVKFLPPEKFANTPAAAAFAKLPKDKLLSFYTSMVTQRLWEDVGKDLFMGGKDGLYGYFHMYIGEEAIAAGAMGALNKDDFITSTHRGHGHIIAKGADINKMSAEIFAKQEGSCKGYGLSMHIVDMSLGIMGSNGIVGGGWWLAAGAAYSAKVRGTKQVALCFAGDQASNSRYFFNAVRNAQNYGWPYIPVIENNFQGTSTGIGFCSAVKYQSELTKGLGIPTFLVDGNDVSQVYDAIKQATDYARANSAPAIVECMTWRWYDHQGFAGAKAGQQGSFGLPYRTDDEVRQWMSRDPIVRYKAFLMDNKLTTAEELAAIDKDVKAKVDAAWDYGRKGKNTTPQMGLLNTYATGTVTPTQFLDRKGTSTAWKTPDYVRQLAKNFVVEA